MNLSIGEAASFLPQGFLCLALLDFVSRFPSCINQAEGLLSAWGHLGPMGPPRMAAILASHHDLFSV